MSRYKVNNITIFGGDPIDFSHDMDGLADFLVEGYHRGVRGLDIELEDGSIMSAQPNEDDCFHQAFGMSQEEWHEQQRGLATKIELTDLLPDGPKNLKEIKNALAERRLNGENVFVEWNGVKCYSVDTGNFYDFEKAVATQWKKDAKYISSLGMSVEDIATAMVEANKQGLNVYTRVEGQKVYAREVMDIDSFYTCCFGKTRERYELDKFREQQQEELRKKEREVVAQVEKQKMRNLAKVKIEPDPSKKEWARKDTTWYSTFDEFAEAFVKKASRGENLYYEFNGVKHYTCEITGLDDLYKKQFGKGYEEWTIEYEAAQKKWHEDYEARRAEAERTLPQRAGEAYEKGLPFIDPSVDESQWRECCDIRCGDLYEGMDVHNAIDIMESMSKGDYEHAAELFDQAGHSGASAGMVFAMVKSFRPGDNQEFRDALDRLERGERGEDGPKRPGEDD